MRPVPSGALDENMPHSVHTECSVEDTLNSNSSWRRHTNVLHNKHNCQCLWYSISSAGAGVVGTLNVTVTCKLPSHRACFSKDPELPRLHPNAFSLAHGGNTCPRRSSAEYPCGFFERSAESFSPEREQAVSPRLQDRLPPREACDNIVIRRSCRGTPSARAMRVTISMRSKAGKIGAAARSARFTRAGAPYCRVAIVVRRKLHP